MRTYTATPSTIKHEWFVIDATNLVLGRLAAEVAHRLRGKHKPEFTPSIDTGDFIIVVNADKIRVTGRKSEEKMYYRHSGYPGGIRAERFSQLMKRAPTRAIEIAVKGMLPKGPLGRQMFRKLKVYAGAEHQHQAQQPQKLELKS
jgi:large subunit ribosomal protein L13